MESLRISSSRKWNVIADSCKAPKIYKLEWFYSLLRDQYVYHTYWMYEFITYIINEYKGVVPELLELNVPVNKRNHMRLVHSLRSHVTWIQLYILKYYQLYIKYMNSVTKCYPFGKSSFFSKIRVWFAWRRKRAYLKVYVEVCYSNIC